MDKATKTQKIIKKILVVLVIVIAIIIFLILWAYFIGLPKIEFCDYGCDMGKLHMMSGEAGLEYLRNMALNPPMAIFMIFLLLTEFISLFSPILPVLIIVLIIFIAIKKSKQHHSTKK